MTGVSMLAAVVCGIGAGGGPAAFSAQAIFPAQEKHCHGSSIIECPNGDLLACWFFGSGERTATDVRIRGARLRKGASEWSPVFEMADSPGFPDCNPVLFVDAKDRLWLFWIQVLAERWECAVLKYRRADAYQNDGPPEWNWQDAIFLKPGQEFADTMKAKFDEMGLEEGMWAEYALPYTRMLVEAAQDERKRQTGWMTRIHPLELPNGRILLPLYSDGFNACLMAISDDVGETWRASKPIIGLGPIQPSLVRRQNGDVVAYLRDSGALPGRIQVSESKDNGESWAASVDTDLLNPGASIEAIALRDGRWLMIFNDSEFDRNPLTAAFSKDEGRTWPVKQNIEPADDQGRSFGYPSVIQTRDGKVHMTYTHKSAAGNCIRHGVLTVE